MTSRKVTELDFRMPEYRDAKPEDYEFREDGKLVRKDRWETGVNSIRHAVGIGIRGEWEISDVVQRVKRLSCPLTDEEILKLFIDEFSSITGDSGVLRFARAIEQLHGIDVSDVID